MLRQDDNESSLLKLPIEVLYEISSLCSFDDLSRLMLVSSSLYNISQAVINDTPVMSKLKIISNASRKEAINIITSWRNYEFYKVLVDNNHKTPYEVLLHALMTDNINKIDREQLSSAIKTALSDIASGKLDKSLFPLLSNLSITEVFIDSSMIDKNSSEMKNASKSICTADDYLDRSEVDFSGTCYLNLSGVDFSGSSLFFWDLTGVNLENANFCTSELFKTRLNYANLKGACLQMTNLKSTHLKGTNLDQSNFISHYIFQGQSVAYSIGMFDEKISFKGLSSALSHAKSKIKYNDSRYTTQQYGYDHELRQAIANDVANQAYALAQSNKRLALEMIEEAISHSIFEHRNFTLPKKFLNSAVGLFSHNKDPYVPTSSQEILIIMKNKIEALTVEQDNKKGYSI